MKTRGLSCPYCNKKMKTLYHYEIEIDRCDACHEIWFDKGEM